MQKKDLKKENNFESNPDMEINCGEIIDRVKKLLEIENDMKLAHNFGMSQNTLYSWRARNNADFILIVEKIKDNFPKREIVFDPTWLLFGKGFDEILMGFENRNALYQKAMAENIALKKENEEKTKMIRDLINLMAENQSKK